MESLLVLLERTQSNLKTLDVWDEQIIADCESGQFDDLIADILEDHQQNKTTKLSNGLKTTG
ncbi:MAG: hypothetical protein R2865_03745 [Deinococcales bacterium]